MGTHSGGLNGKVSWGARNCCVDGDILTYYTAVYCLPVLAKRHYLLDSSFSALPLRYPGLRDSLWRMLQYEMTKMMPWLKPSLPAMPLFYPAYQAFRTFLRRKVDRRAPPESQKNDL